MKYRAFALWAFVLVCGCGDASTAGDIRSWTGGVHTTNPGYGWEEPIDARDFVGVASKLGHAETTIAGHSLRAIVTDANVKVRGDDQACVACHAWATDSTRANFCARVPDFLAQPTAKGDGHDPSNAKPQILKDILFKWHADGCP